MSSSTAKSVKKQAAKARDGQPNAPKAKAPKVPKDPKAPRAPKAVDSFKTPAQQSKAVHSSESKPTRRGRPPKNQQKVKSNHRPSKVEDWSGLILQQEEVGPSSVLYAPGTVRFHIGSDPKIEAFLVDKTVLSIFSKIVSELSEGSYVVRLPTTSPITFKRFLQILGVEEGRQVLKALPIHDESKFGPQTAIWTPQNLLDLYLLASVLKCPYVCDIIADVWVEALQLIQGAGDAYSYKGKAHLWKPSKELFEEEPLQPTIQVANESDKYDADLPILSQNVGYLNHDIITTLYEGTEPECKGRLIWAQAIVLCGSELPEKMLLEGKETWPSDLKWDVATVAMRMVRKTLHLVIEQKKPDVWCRAYHEHDRFGMPCYRGCDAQTDVDRARGKGNGRKRSREDEAVGEGGEGQQDSAKKFRAGTPPDDEVEQRLEVSAQQGEDGLGDGEDSELDRLFQQEFTAQGYDTAEGESEEE